MAESDGQIQQEKKARVETEERKAMVEELAKAEEIADTMSKELEQYKEKDPEIINGRKRTAEEALKHANRWTGGSFSFFHSVFRRFV